MTKTKKKPTPKPKQSFYINNQGENIMFFFTEKDFVIAIDIKSEDSVEIIFKKVKKYKPDPKWNNEKVTLKKFKSSLAKKIAFFKPYTEIFNKAIGH